LILIPLPLAMVPKSFEFRTLDERLQNVRSRVAESARRCNRAPDELTLLAVSKGQPAEVLREALRLGVYEFGENRVQEAEEKISEVGRDAARWHLVGHLQANKARRAVNLFDVIHSLDSVSLAQRLDRLCEEENRTELLLLIQIDLGGEDSKSGIDPRELPTLVTAIRECERLRLIGLMTLPPYFENPDCARPFFKTLRELRDELQSEGHFGDRQGELSMGMTHDFEIAIEEGATILRVGTAIFGERK
jgi:pyridoxal phosphate enzyme (YggS family)